MKKSWFTVQALADGRTAQVAVRGYIGEWGVTDRDFIAAVEAFGDVDTIDVAINSRGGEVDHALSIFNFLRNHPAKVNMRVDGVAMSAASIILMAGDEIAMPANAILMIHSPWSYASGNADDLRQAADVLDTFESALLETYQARSGKTADDLKTMLADETFMTAKEAVANGFADRVIPLKAEARAASAVAYAAALDIPLDVLERAQAEALADAEGGDHLKIQPAGIARQRRHTHQALVVRPAFVQRHARGVVFRQIRAGRYHAGAEIGVEAARHTDRRQPRLQFGKRRLQRRAHRNHTRTPTAP
jgi:ATP-dependent protease ClpP protease subunit